jgi:hypothetical protein
MSDGGPVAVTVNDVELEEVGPLGPDPISASLAVTRVEAVVAAGPVIRVTTEQSPITAVSIAAAGPAGPQGREGPSGPAGPSGPPGGSFVFTQGTPSATWTIAHALGKFPSVFVLDSALDSVEGVVAFVDTNSLTVTFSAPFAGTAYLN